MTMKAGDIVSYQLGELDPERLRKSLASEFTVQALNDESALDVAARFDREAVGIVVLVDRTGEPVGIIDPTALQQRLRSEKGIHSDSLQDALKKLEVAPGERQRGFRHEWIDAAYDPHWCLPGQHYTTLAPCPRHER
jgi:hypothetical protein